MKNPYKLLETLEIPVSYFKFDEVVKAPFIVYKGSGSNNTIADNRVFYSENTYEIEYYFDRKNEELEKRITDLFDENEIIWSKSEDIYIQEEELFVIYFYLN